MTARAPGRAPSDGGATRVGALDGARGDAHPAPARGVERRRSAWRSTMACAVALATFALAPSVARASAPDTFGFSARAEGLAGAMTAEATGYAATHHNPAGVACAARVEAAVGYGAGAARLTLDGEDARVTAPRGTSIGLAAPLALGPVRAAFGLSLYLPDQFLARIQLVPASEPHFVLLDNDLDHLVVTPVLAIAWRWLALGAGLTVLADAAGSGVAFDVGVVGGEKVSRGELDVTLPTRLAPVAGLRVAPWPWLRAGVAYRGAIDLGLRLDVLARVDLAGAVRGDTLISLRAVSLYTPARLSAGVAVELAPSLLLTTELDWVRWSGFRGGVPDLEVLVALGVSPSLVRGMFPRERWDDVVTPRIGVEWRRRASERVRVAARLGYAFERSPVPDQVGLTCFADDDRHVLAVGGGVELARVVPFLARPVRLDVAAQWHELAPRTTRKDARFAPGAGFSSGGRLLHVAATLELGF